MRTWCRYCGRALQPVKRPTTARSVRCLVYFTHPCWGGEDIDTMAPDPRTRLSHVRAAVLEVRGGNLVCTEH